ncbi:MAG: AAA family ATPase [Legionellales bacterium]|nr:AAA family ATPase [Legionellales bacterium]|tara:strand:- start:139679 stop:141145 length:1467 start_codon:yes stop_codon:yes gene_type:complete
MNQTVIGREPEKAILHKLWQAQAAQFLALYGRRRIGKTYLIRQFFHNKGLYIEVTGLKDGSTQEQIANFMQQVYRQFPQALSLKIPENWHIALEIFTEQIEALPKTKKATLFLDELPWLATKRSGLMQAIDYFWNTRWCKLKNFRLIVCGSSASWMLDNLVHAKGGLHNRLTQSILLQPFNLHETMKYCKSLGLSLSNKQLLELYMVMGGVPYYLNQITKSKSASQNINDICFNKNGLLYNEFSSLFSALFDNPEINRLIIQTIANKNHGISREELLKQTKLSSGGRFNHRINELTASHFIQEFVPYGRTRRDIYYKIIDPYTLFYLRWIEPLYKSSRQVTDKGYWLKKLNTPAYNTWSGYAFESICLNHTAQIAKALGLEHIAYETGSWQFIPRKNSQEQGAQIDLLFDRNDGIIDICEIKYCHKQYTVDKAYAKNLANKMDVFSKHIKIKKHIHLNMICAMGLKHNLWSDDLVQQAIDLNALFAAE